MVINQPPKSCGHIYCCSGDTMFLVVEGQDSKCSRLNPSLLFGSQAHGMSCSLIRNFAIKTRRSG